mmetsp:Transcript_11289/g.13953  ORF Transcript_11289/g.13953 Transcript_11289/m.13953 type:complete len:141 (-) Transcript_11289:1642-2064(-)
MSLFVRSSRPLFASRVFRPTYFAAPSNTTRFFSSQPPPRKARWYVTRKDVAKHNNPDDAWIIIHGKVYDVTEWELDHPGGDKILMNVGHDSTELFEAVEHSEFARDMMKKYYIADLVPEEAKRRYTLDTYTGEGPEQNMG